MNWFFGISGRWKGASSPTKDAPHAVLAAHGGGQTNQPAVRGDNPISTVTDDKLGRAPAATAFGDQILSLDPREGVVVGVLGPWGSGKTSFVNLARLELKKAGVDPLDFNPWMFSGAEQLVDAFFTELSSQLKLRPGFAEVGKDFEEYGEMFSGMGWLPLVGPWIERARAVGKVLSTIMQHRKEGIGQRREKLRKALTQLDKPIVVVLDDIDRLSTSEIRDVFKLIRLTASFPQIIYVVAFDRLRVEDALSEQKLPGRDYLEKILQLAIDLPAVPDLVFRREILATMDQALAGIENPGPFDGDVWPDIFMEVVRPLMRNMRDVRRYGLAIRGAVKDLNGQIALADVLALEAVRMFLPDVFRRLHATVEALTSTSSGVTRDDSQLKKEIDDLIEAGGEHKAVVHDMIVRLFPAAARHIEGSHFGPDWVSRWVRERRVAHEDILRLYLERVVGEGLEAFNQAERAWGLLADRAKLDAYLRSLQPEILQDVIGALENYQADYSHEQVVPATIVLLNLLPDLPVREGGILEFSTTLVVTRVTYRLLRSLGDPARIEAATREILPNVKTLTAKLELITDVGYRENQGHKMVSEAAAAEFERAWRDEVRASPLERLLREKELLKVLVVAKRDSGPSESPIIIAPDPALTLALLKGARQEVKSQTLGDRAVRRSARLEWDVLVRLYGTEDVLKQRIEALKATGPQGVDDLLALADKYAAGWRPRRGED